MKSVHSLMVTAAAVALLTFSLTGVGFAEMKSMSHGEHSGGHGQMMDMESMEKMDDMMGMCLKHADKIGLSEEQSSKLKPIHREMQKKQVRFKAEQKIAELELMEIMDVKDFDLEKANSAVKKSAELKTAHKLEMLAAMKEARTVLTVDQFKKMKKMMAMPMGAKKPAKKMMKK